MSQASAAAADADVGSYGTSNRKMVMWAFIGSECMFFASLISAYVVDLGQSQTGPYPTDLLSVPFITVTTFVLLMSSLTMVLALSAVQRGDRKMARVWLFMTPFLGAVFLTGQVIEFTHFWHEGLTLSQNLFGTTFYILTGFHGAHVTVAALWMFAIWWLHLKGDITQENAETVEIAGLYWHFVDIVWIVLFTVIYLMMDV